VEFVVGEVEYLPLIRTGPLFQPVEESAKLLPGLHRILGGKISTHSILEDLIIPTSAASCLILDGAE